MEMAATASTTVLLAIGSSPPPFISTHGDPVSGGGVHSISLAGSLATVCLVACGVLLRAGACICGRDGAMHGTVPCSSPHGHCGDILPQAWWWM